MREAVAEIRKVAKKEPALAGEGAVTFFERVSPAIEQVDGSSGSMSAAVHAAIGALVPIIGAAPVDTSTREDWLTRLLQAMDADGMAYIESLADSFGELCGSEAIASAWADRLIELARVALQPGEGIRAHRASTSACLSALYRAGRYDELVDVLEEETFWTYNRWAVKALAARGDTDAALHLAESCRSPWASHASIDALCEEILLAAGRIEEAYASYGARASQRGTYLATFRAVQQKYPHKAAAEILADLVESFAAPRARAPPARARSARRTRAARTRAPAPPKRHERRRRGPQRLARRCEIPIPELHARHATQTRPRGPPLELLVGVVTALCVRDLRTGEREREEEDEATVHERSDDIR